MILKDVEKAHMSFYENDIPKSKENFNIWLENQGFLAAEERRAVEKYGNLKYRVVAVAVLKG